MGGCHKFHMVSFPTAGNATGPAWFVLSSKAASIVAWPRYRAFPLWVPLKASMSFGVHVSTVFPVIECPWNLKSPTSHRACFFVLGGARCNNLAFTLQCPGMPVPTTDSLMWPTPELLGFISHSLEHRYLNKVSDMLATSHSSRPDSMQSLI